MKLFFDKITIPKFDFWSNKLKMKESTCCLNLLSGLSVGKEKLLIENAS